MKMLFIGSIIVIFHFSILICKSKVYSCNAFKK